MRRFGNKLLLISWITFLTTAYSQQIVNYSHFQPYYNVDKKEITLSGGNPDVLRHFLHELGHHIWFYGGVDTAAFREDNNWYWGDIKELFAHEHYYYFIGEAMSNNRKIFDEFYNRKN